MHWLLASRDNEEAKEVTQTFMNEQDGIWLDQCSCYFPTPNGQFEGVSCILDDIFFSVSFDKLISHSWIKGKLKKSCQTLLGRFENNMVQMVLG